MAPSKDQEVEDVGSEATGFGERMGSCCLEDQRRRALAGQLARWYGS